MKLDEFRDWLDAHGADLSAWPEAQRAAADRLLADDPAAHAALQEVRELDRLIAASVSGAHDASAGRVLARLARPLPPQRRSRLSWAWPAALLDVDLAPARLRIAALAGVAALGVVLGLFGPDVTDASVVVASAGEPDLAVFEPEPLTGVRP
jgi:anti-sigma factor RsiW